GSTMTIVSLDVPSDRYAGSSVGVVTAVPSNDAAWTDSMSGPAVLVAGLEPWDRADPGTAAMASRAVSARLATTIGRRTSFGRAYQRAEARMWTSAVRGVAET